jgi:hypothetical protein
MLDSVSKVERYRKEANRCAGLAKEASPPFVAEIYRKVAVRYVFMAEELLKGPARDEDAIERADRMTSRLQPDTAIEGPRWCRAGGLAPASIEAALLAENHTVLQAYGFGSADAIGRML